MALVDVYSVPIIDDAGASRRVQVYFPTGLAVADIQAFSDVFLPELDAVTGGVISGPSVTFALTLPGGLKVSALSDHFNKQGALLSFGAAATNYSHSMYVPSYRDTLISGGEIDVADADFIALRDRILTGEIGPPARLPSDKYGNDIDTFQSAVLSFRK